MTQRPASIKTIAEALGISHMTVSRALRDQKGVNVETRKAVLECAAALGYVENTAARVLRGGRTPVVGLILPNLENEFYAKFATSFSETCAENGLNTIIHLTRDDPDREQQAFKQLQELQVFGTVLVPVPSASRPDPAPNTRIVNLIRERAQPETVPHVLFNERLAFRQATRHLLDQGFRRLAFIGPEPVFSSGTERYQGFLETIQSKPAATDKSLHVFGPPNFHHGASAAETLIECADPPDAILCAGFEITRGALDACLNKGLAFPTDIGFLGYGDPTYFQFVAGGISAFALPIEDLAAHAVTELLQAPPGGSVKALLDIRLVPRRSTCKRNP